MAKNTSKPGELFNPFPGLRPFTPEESHLFFGREGQSKFVVDSLIRNNFIAVIGASGSGKSSLIYCGVIPELKAKTNKKWVTISSRPGTSPILNLVLSAQKVIGSKVKETDVDMLSSEKHAIHKWIDGFIPKDQHLLLVVDQFEEIFRFRQSGDAENAAEIAEHFVHLLHSASTDPNSRISVVLTMRSDFIGECSVFQDLTELINHSNYLIPQMTRDDFRKAIEGPIKVGGATIDQVLLEQLLDEVGTDTDQLPVLQHSMMRTFDYWLLQKDPEKPITMGDYEAIGRIEKALSDHANEAYEELNEEQRRLCELMFKTLTELGGDNRGVRRPNTVKKIAEIAQCSPEEIIDIAEVFRIKGRTFLTPYKPVEIVPDTVIDISHESLMRIWDRLRLWVDEEADSVQMYNRLSEASELFQKGTSGLWRPPDLDYALNWREKQEPTSTWAVQYNPAFERAMVFLETSDAEYRKEEENKIRLQKRRLRVTRIFTMVVGGIAIIAVGLFLYSQNLAAIAAANAERATLASDSARMQADTAALRAQEALDAQAEALAQQNRAEQQAEIAAIRAQEAIDAQLLATENEKKATLASDSAKQQARIAEDRRLQAEAAQQAADLAAAEAQRQQRLSIAQSMAVKSEQMRVGVDTMLKGLLAYQAYTFNRENEGVPYDPDIFAAAYSGYKFFEGQNYNLLKGHNERVPSIVPYGEYFISGSTDGKVVQWNIETKDSTILLRDLSSVTKMVIDEDRLFIITFGGLVIYDLKNRSSTSYPFPSTPVPIPYRNLIVLNDGNYLLVYKERIYLTNSVEDRGDEFFIAEAEINVARYNGKSGKLFVGTADGKIYRWNSVVGSGSEPEIFVERQGQIWGDIMYEPELNMLATGSGTSDGSIYLYNEITGSQINTPLQGHNAQISGIRISMRDTLMISSSTVGEVNIWHLNDLNTLPIIFDELPPKVNDIRFSRDEKSIVSAFGNGSIIVLPTDVEMIIHKYCEYLTRTLTETEWQTYVGMDIEYEPATCN